MFLSAQIFFYLILTLRTPKSLKVEFHTWTIILNKLYNISEIFTVSQIVSWNKSIEEFSSKYEVRFSITFKKRKLFIDNLVE